MTFRVTKKSLAEYARFATSGRIVVFDTETTGISREDEIVQLAAVEFVNGEQTRTFMSYLQPGVPMNPGAAAVNGLTDEFLAEHGRNPIEVLDEFFAFLGSDVLLVAHNIGFDFRMLQHECRAYDYFVDVPGLVFCDTIALARKLVPGLPHYRLSALIPALHLEGTNSHDALDDTQACAHLFFYLIGNLCQVSARLTERTKSSGVHRANLSQSSIS